MAMNASPDSPTAGDYFLLEPDMVDGMLLQSIPDPPSDPSWTLGARFSSAPQTPVPVTICEGYEEETPLPYVNVPPVMSTQLLEVLLATGVGNIDAYDAELVSEDGRVRLQGYKAFNVIGLVAAADMAQSRFAPDNPSRSLDASFDSLALNSDRIRGLLLFRLAEYSSAVVVHRSVRQAIEDAGITGIVFRKPAEFLS
jgi:hypothetical protein